MFCCKQGQTSGSNITKRMFWWNCFCSNYKDYYKIVHSNESFCRNLGQDGSSGSFSSEILNWLGREWAHQSPSLIVPLVKECSERGLGWSWSCNWTCIWTVFGSTQVLAETHPSGQDYSHVLASKGYMPGMYTWWCRGLSTPRRKVSRRHGFHYECK